MGISVNENGIVTVTLPSGEVVVLPEVVTDLGMSPTDDNFHAYYADSEVGFSSYEAWETEHGQGVGTLR